MTEVESLETVDGNPEIPGPHPGSGGGHIGNQGEGDNKELEPDPPVRKVGHGHGVEEDGQTEEPTRRVPRAQCQ